VCEQGLEQPPIRPAVRAQLLCGVLERAPCEDSSSVVERVCDCGGRFDQIEVELQRAEEG
jgi:hypothetical protein